MIPKCWIHTWLNSPCLFSFCENTANRCHSTAILLLYQIACLGKEGKGNANRSHPVPDFHLLMISKLHQKPNQPKKVLSRKFFFVVYLRKNSKDHVAPRSSDLWPFGTVYNTFISNLQLHLQLVFTVFKVPVFIPLHRLRNNFQWKLWQG